jgi:TonB-dependent starch-binding outer membrane protein SusC
MERFFTVFFLFMAMTLPSFGQDRMISGTVTSEEDGSALPGVNVIVEGTSKGTTTDINGLYTITLAPSETTLTFSFVGFKSVSEQVGSRTTINVVLPLDVDILEAVVVVGYGVQQKSDITGATATVKGHELMQQPVLTATQAMQGKVAGVQIISSGQPGTSPQIRVRGTGTVLGQTTALFVVDGVLTDDISNINTADIVDMTVLKDASAAAIYGSRGANGVVIITTRKGKEGGIQINYSNNIGIRQAANLVEMANSAEYANYVQAATGTAPPTSEYSTDWYDQILRTAFQQSHNISLSGATDKVNYFFNAGYLKDEGIVINNDFSRFTLRYNNEYKIRDNLTFGLNSSYGNNVNQNGFGNINIDAYGNIGGVYNNTYRAAPIIPAIVDGRYGNTSAYQNVGNALLDVNNNDIKVKENRLQATSFLELKPLEWLTLRTQIGGDWRNSLNRGYFYKFLADENTFLISGGNQARPLSNLSVAQHQTFRWVWDNTATLSKQFNEHSVTLLVGTTAEKLNYHMLSATRSDVGADPNLWYIHAGNANTSQNDGGGDAWSRNSYLARVNYGFAEKYLLTATIRSDGSSRLPSKYRWRNYPSIGIGWVLSREAFLSNQSLFDMLKIRASYGKVGNEQIPTNEFREAVTLNRPYAFNGSVSDATNGSRIDQIKDRNIRWEDTEEYDVALEIEMFQSRLTGEISYYNKRISNALGRIPVDGTTGDFDGLITTNIATAENKGVEVLLNWRNKINDDWSYNIGGNVTFNENRVLDLNGGQGVYGGAIGAAQGFTTYTDVGQPIGSFYVLKVLGVFNSGAEVNAYTNGDGQMIQPTAKAGDFKYQDTNADGVISDSDRIFAGSYQPVAYYGINAGVNFRRWDLSIAIYGNAGNEVYNGKKAVKVDGKDNIERDVVYDRWTSQNQTQSEPAANVGNLPASTYFVESGSFARINNLTLGYTLNPQQLERLHLSSLRIFVTSQNLFTYQKYSGFTAELPGDPLNSGIELSSYPTTRTIAGGINVTF